MMDKDEFDKINKLENTHWWYVGTREIALDILKKYLPNTQIKILDIGCGTGGNMQALQKFGEVEGNDIDDYTVELCKNKNLNCYVADVSTNKLPHEKYDVITCFDVINQVTPSTLESSIQNIAEGLKKDGLFVLREPSPKFANGRHDLAVRIQTRFTKSQLIDLLKKNGFIIKRATYINFLLFIPILIKRKIDLKRFPTPKSDIYEINPTLNSILLQFLRIENLLLKYVDFPFGISLFIIAQKE